MTASIVVHYHIVNNKETLLSGAGSKCFSSAEKIGNWIWDKLDEGSIVIIDKISLR